MREVNTLIEKAQDDLEAVLFGLIGERDQAISLLKTAHYHAKLESPVYRGIDAAEIDFFLTNAGDELADRARANQLIEPDHKPMLARLREIAANATLHQQVTIDEADLRQLLAWADAAVFD